MKFIIDAQLPKSLAVLLNTLGNDAIHTIDLPAQNSTTDNFIALKANEEDRVVVTKDSDFLESYLVKSLPSKLLIVKTGNIKNKELLELFQKQISLINEIFETNSYIEMTIDEIIVHQ